MNFTNISNFNESLEMDEMTSTLSVYLSEAETAGVVGFVAIFGFAGFLQNLVLILSISLTDGFADAPANLFVLSLACADLLLCVVSAPLFIYSIYNSFFSIFMTVASFLVSATTGNIFLLTLNRFVSILRPLKYPKIMTFKRAVTMIGVVWFVANISLVVAVVGLLSGIKRPRILRYSMAFYITSSTVMCVYMYNLGRKHKKELAQQTFAVTGQKQATSQEIRALSSLFMIAGSFVVCWLPATIAAFFINRVEGPTQFYRAFCFTGPLALVNSIIDPVVYYYRGNGFRSSLKVLVRQFRNRGYCECW